MKFFLLSIPFALGLSAQLDVIATGLQGPQKLVLTPRGNFLVTETSMQSNSGRVSFVSRSGARRSLFEALPSGIESVGGGSGPSAMALSGRTLYVAIGGGETERRTATGASIHNPAGLSSPLFSSILRVQFSADVDSISGAFRLTLPQQQAIADGDDVELDDGAGSKATVSLLTDIPDAVQEGTIYKFSNPWGLLLSGDGATLWLTDASQNSLRRIDTTSGRAQRVMRFPALRNAGAIGPPFVDAVPTSLRAYGDSILVSFLTGFPFASGYSRVQLIDPVKRTASDFIWGITSATDVLFVDRGASQRAQFFVLEFSTNQSAAPAPPGRLLRYDSPAATVVASNLRGPVNMAYDASTEELFILEISGRILRVSTK